MPRFLNDQTFLPLQAADFWAWWIRKWCADGALKEKLDHAATWPWGAKDGGYPRLHISYDEEQLVGFFMKVIGEAIEPSRPIYDLKYARDPVHSAAGMTNIRFRGPSPF
jgi:hypothetical protein